MRWSFPYFFVFFVPVRLCLVTVALLRDELKVLHVRWKGIYVPSYNLSCNELTSSNPTIPLGPQAQRVYQSYLTPDYLFEIVNNNLDK